MQPAPPTHGRPARLALVVGALVALLGLVAVASRSGFGHTHNASPSSTYVSYAFTVFLIVFVLMIPVALWSWFMQTREHLLAGRRSSKLAQALRLIRTILVLAVLVWVLHKIGPALANLTHHKHVPQKVTTPTSNASRFGKGGGAKNPHFEWTVLWIVLAAAAIASIVAVQRYRRMLATTLPPLLGPDTAGDVAATIDDAIDDLASEPDPRRAVIAAYARMEGVLGRHGMQRRESETALEYLRRVLNRLTSNRSAVERLTSLFEIAKFSSHDVSTAMKGDAIAALTDIRSGIRT